MNDDDRMSPDEYRAEMAMLEDRAEMQELRRAPGCPLPGAELLGWARGLGSCGATRHVWVNGFNVVPGAWDTAQEP